MHRYRTFPFGQRCPMAAATLFTQTQNSYPPRNIQARFVHCFHHSLFFSVLFIGRSFSLSCLERKRKRNEKQMVRVSDSGVHSGGGARYVYIYLLRSFPFSIVFFFYSILSTSVLSVLQMRVKIK